MSGIIRIIDINKYNQRISDGCLVLTSSISNIENYTQEIVNNELILTPKKENISNDQINKMHLTKSLILESLVITNNDVLVSNNLCYSSILIDIWQTMPTQKILQNSSFDFKLTVEKGHEGFWWNDKLQMSFRLKNKNETLKEIITMVKLNKYKLKMTIQLNDCKRITFNL